MGNDPRPGFEVQATEWLRRHPASITDCILPPYCPRRYGHAAKCKAKNYSDLRTALFCTMLEHEQNLDRDKILEAPTGIL